MAYNPNASALIEATNRTVYELEAEAVSQLALMRAVSAPLRNQLQAAQAALEGHILTRTTAQGAVAS